MKPVCFTCYETLPMAPEKIAAHFLDLTKWPDFHGWGPIPGIKPAEFETQTPNFVGTRIRVTNLDGSTHVEEILEWQPNKRLRLLMGNFSPPLSRLATTFVETWEFQEAGRQAKVTRSFEMTPKSALAKPLLWLLSIFLKRAVARHLSEIKQAAKEQ